MAKLSSRDLNRLLNLAARRPINKRRGRRRPRRTSRKAPRQLMLAPKQLEHANLLQRPFVAATPSSGGGYYCGEQGSINRFVVDASPGTGATGTCVGVILHPNTGYVYQWNAATGTTAITVAPVFNNQCPGFTYLTANASKQRSLAAGIRFACPSLSYNTLVGEFAVGVVSYDTAISFTNTDQFFTHAASRSNVSKDYHEIRWYPGSFDDKYSTVSAVSTGTDGSDTNVVFVVFRGLPNNLICSVQYTSVVEWTPKPGTGLAPTMTHSAGTDHQHTVETMTRSSPGWHHTAKATAERLFDSAAHTVAKKAEKWVPEMLTAGLAAFGL